MHLSLILIFLNIKKAIINKIFYLYYLYFLKIIKNRLISILIKKIQILKKSLLIKNIFRFGRF